MHARRLVLARQAALVALSVSADVLRMFGGKSLDRRLDLGDAAAAI